jgi:hypothetical protein
LSTTGEIVQNHIGVGCNRIEKRDTLRILAKIIEGHARVMIDAHQPADLAVRIKDGCLRIAFPVNVRHQATECGLADTALARNDEHQTFRFVSHFEALLFLRNANCVL